ncbi:hypothetical protein B1219_19270 [Pseudomonas ogarae]|jgi:hypothetical protein|nr:hypothetical protein B1219_19270 [Pseudomonas ogarae]OPG81315.1 hypothetical protein B1218_00510 [Pseudomonas ogarae]
MLASSRCQITKQRRSFTPEFKREAADLVLKLNYSYIEASRSLGIGGPSNCAGSAARYQPFFDASLQLDSASPIQRGVGTSAGRGKT